MTLNGLVASIDGRQIIRDEIRGLVDQAESLGVALAERLLDAGGDKILEEIYGRA